MDNVALGAGLAALAIIGPAVGIGILAGMSSSAIGRNPDAAGIDPRPGHHPGRVRRRPRRARHRHRPAHRLPPAGSARVGRAQPGPRTGASDQLVRLAAESGEGGGLTINLFWIIVAAANFIVFFYIAYKLVLVPVGERLTDRRERIEQGLKDADAARRDREAAADQRAAVLAEARREASEIVARAQKLSDETREKGVADTQAEIERLREQAVADIDAERKRALADVRGQVADLALHGRRQGRR